MWSLREDVVVPAQVKRILKQLDVSPCRMLVRKRANENRLRADQKFRMRRLDPLWETIGRIASHEPRLPAVQQRSVGQWESLAGELKVGPVGLKPASDPDCHETAG